MIRHALALWLLGASAPGSLLHGIGAEGSGPALLRQRAPTGFWRKHV